MNMYRAIEVWDTDDVAEMDFDTYQAAFDVFAEEFAYGTLPSIDFLIVDLSTGEVVLQASTMKMA